MHYACRFDVCSLSGIMTEASFHFGRKLFTVLLVFAALYLASNFFIPLAIGGVLATLFIPVCRWLERKHVPRLAACLTCLLLVLACIAAVATLVGWQITSLANDAELIKQRITEMLGSLQQNIYDSIGISKEQQIQILKKQESMARAVIATIAGSVAGIVTSGALSLVYTCLLLYYRDHIRKFILKATPSGQKKEIEDAVSKAVLVSQQYLMGLGKMIVCLWIMYAIGFSIVGVKNAIFFAILCGLLEIIPFIGNITGTFLTLITSSVQGADGAMLIGIIVTYGIVQFIQGWILETTIVGPQVKINPLITIIALVGGELIWGIPGIILAIPLTAMFKIMCDHIDPLKPYGYLFGETERSGRHSRKSTVKEWLTKLRKKVAGHNDQSINSSLPKPGKGE
jgi:predicted PurR-regulated permease PerM